MGQNISMDSVLEPIVRLRWNIKGPYVNGRSRNFSFVQNEWYLEMKLTKELNTWSSKITTYCKIWLHPCPSPSKSSYYLSVDIQFKVRSKSFYESKLLRNNTLSICLLDELMTEEDINMENWEVVCTVRNVIFSYEELQTATQNFCDRPLRAGGCKIGEGGFGTVYRAVIRGDDVAIKRLKDAVDPQFITELKTLTNYTHENLLPLLGCCPGPKCCLVCKYMPNGSLEDRLACKDQTKPLSWKTRLSISYGSAVGINHLHTFKEMPVVHRDIKSANILLDQNFVPKVGDCGLVRMGNSGESTTLPVTKICCGTCGYMPREALLGDVSVKWDTFSFGVVLLELLTGLPPYDLNRKNRFLITHMENCENILTRLDSKANWNQDTAAELYRLTQRCLTEKKRSRPTISEILDDLRNCLS